MKNAIFVILMYFVFSFNCFSKIISSDTEFRGYVEQIFVEETPMPSISETDKSKGYMIFVRNFMQRVYPATIPKQDEIKNKIGIISAKGEYEPVTFGIYPLKDLGEVSVNVSDLVNQNGGKISKDNVEIRIVRYMAQRVGLEYMKYFMVIPKSLEPYKRIHIDKEKTREYWLTIYVPPSTDTGKYTGKITVTPSVGSSSSIDLELEVLPFTIETPPNVVYGMLMMFELSPLSMAKSESEIKSSEVYANCKKLFKKFKETGLNMLSIESHDYQEVNGEPFLGDLEAAEMLSKELGFTKPVFFYPGAVLRSAKLKNLGNYTGYNSSIHPALAKKIVSHYIKKSKEKGWPGIVIMPTDEPNVGDGVKPTDPPDARVKIAKELLQAVKSVPESVTWTAVTPESIKSIADWVDYRIYGIWTYKDVLETKQAGKKFGYYPYIFGTHSATFPRFVFGFCAWAIGASAVTPWQCQIGEYGRPVDFMKKGGDSEVATKIKKFLGEDDKPVPTISWECIREGIKDVKYIYKLETLISEAKKLNKTEVLELANESERFLKDIKDDIISIVSKKWSFEHYATGEPIPVGKWDENYFNECREKIIQYCVRLSEKIERR